MQTTTYSRLCDHEREEISIGLASGETTKGWDDETIRLLRMHEALDDRMQTTVYPRRRITEPAL